MKDTGWFHGLAVVLAVTGSAGHATAGDMAASGFTVSVPEKWSARDVCAADTARGVSGAWADEDESGAANLVVGLRADSTPISGARVASARREIVRRLAVRQGPGREELRDVRLVELAGLPAFRIRASLEAGGVAVEQLQYVVSGRSTLALTFTCSRAAFAAREGEFEAVARSLRAADPPAEASAGACGGLLGLIAGLIAAARARRRTRAVVSRCISRERGPE